MLLVDPAIGEIRGVKGEAVVKNPDQRSGLFLKKKPD
jgi:hypothetical protein